MDQVNENVMQKEPSMPSPRALGREAAAVTHKSGVWLHLTVALLAAMLVTHAISSFFMTLRAFLAIVVTDIVTWYILTYLFSVLTVLGVLFLAMPVWFARLRAAALLADDKEVAARDILYYFSEKKRLFRAWRISLVAGLFGVLTSLALWALFGGAVLLYVDVFVEAFPHRPAFAVFLLVLCLLGALLITAPLLFFAGVFLPFVAVALGNEEMSVRQAFVCAFSAAKRRKRYIFRFTLCQIPHVLLSLVTIGVYYVFWYAPRFVLSYLRLSQALCTIHSCLKEDLS